MAIGQELSSINFESMTGGPLNTIIQTQAQSAQTFVDFTKNVGFNEDDGKPAMVTFSYDKL